MADASSIGAPERKGPHRWQPGESGNPEGRKPDAELAEVRRLTKDLFEPHVADAVSALVRICKSGRSEAAVVAAAEKIIERARGKAPINIEDSQEGTSVFEFVLRKAENADKEKAG